VQTHAVPIEAGQPAATTSCGSIYSRVNANLDWFDPKYAFAVQRCAECAAYTVSTSAGSRLGRTISLGMSVRGRLDQWPRRSHRAWDAPSVTVNPRGRLTHRARNGHGGLFVP
jgi:hypothetical protein